MQHDVPCTRCGYDLRGLGDDGRCPECGAAIAPSVARFVLLHAASRPLAEMPRAWVVRLAAGCSLLTLLGFAVFAITTAQLLIDPRWRQAWTPVQLLMVIALWLLTAREPSAAAMRASARAIRWIARTGVIVAAMWMIVRTSLQVPVSVRTAGPLYAMIASVTTAAVMFHLARLAARLPRRDLRVEAAALMILLPLATFAQAVFFRSIIFPAAGRSWWTLPEPIVGDAAALILVPYALALGHPWDASLAFWTVLAVLMAWTLSLLPRFALALWRAAANQPVARRAVTV